MRNLAVFISGKGSLLSVFKSTFRENFKLVVASRDCEGVEKSNELGIPVLLAAHLSEDFAYDLIDRGITLICLAGYLKVIPADFITAFNSRGGLILNSHPSLIPAYSGEGFYGNRVHKAVIEAGEKVSGFTIHEVTPEVDAGPVLFKKEIPVFEGDTWEDLAEKIQKEEKVEYVKIASGIGS